MTVGSSGWRRYGRWAWRTRARVPVGIPRLSGTDSERRMVARATTDGVLATVRRRARRDPRRGDRNVPKGSALASVVLLLAAGSSLRAQGGPAVPPSAGRVLWLRADLGVTMGLSDLVTEWHDASNPAVELSNVWTCSFPEWRAAAVGGQPALHFDGNDFLYGAGMPTGSYTKVVVCELDDLAAQNNVLSGFKGHALDFGGGDRARLSHVRGASGGDFVTSTQGVVAHVPVVLVATFDASTGNGTIWQDGVAVGHGHDDGRGNTDVTLLLGSFAYSGFFVGSLAEVVVYDRVLAGRDLDELHDYLLRRYRAGAPRVH